MAENQPSRAEVIGAAIQNRRSVDNAGTLQSTLDKYHVQKTEFAIGTRLFELENRIKTEVDRIQHSADIESKRTGKKVVAENPFEDGEMTKMFTNQLKSLVTDARNMNKQMLEVQIGRMDKIMKSLSESDISQKKLLEDEYEKSMAFLKEQHELRSNLVTRSMSKIGEVAEQYLDLQSLYSGFVNHNPIMMGLFRVGSDIVKNHRIKKQEQKKLQAEDAHRILMAEKLENERKEQMLLEAQRKEELDSIKKETAKTEQKTAATEQKAAEDVKNGKESDSGSSNVETKESTNTETITRDRESETRDVLTREMVIDQIEAQKDWLRTTSQAPEEFLDTVFERDVRLEKLQEQLARIEAGEVLHVDEPKPKNDKKKSKTSDKENNTTKTSETSETVKNSDKENNTTKTSETSETVKTSDKVEDSKIHRIDNSSDSIQDDNETRKLIRDTKENAKEDRQEQLQTKEGLFERLDTIIDLLKENVDNTEKTSNTSGGDGFSDNILQALVSGKGNLLKGGLGAAAGVLGLKKVAGLAKKAKDISPKDILKRGGSSAKKGLTSVASKGKSLAARTGSVVARGAGGLMSGTAAALLAAGATGYGIGNLFTKTDIGGKTVDAVSHGMENVFRFFGSDRAEKMQEVDSLFKKESESGALLTQIAKGEGTDEKSALKKGYKSGYDVTLGYGKYDPDGFNKPISEMTIGEVKKFQTGMLKHPENNHNSSAVGKYQITKTTLNDLQKVMGFSDSDKFSPEMQDKMAIELMERRGLSKAKSGEITHDEFQDNLSKEWASIAHTSDGKSYYGQHTGTSTAEIQGAIQVATASPNLEAVPSKASIDKVNTMERNVEEISYHKQQMAAEAAQPQVVPVPTGGEKSGNRNATKSSGGGVTPLGSARNPDSSIQRVTDRYISFGNA